MKIFKDKTYNKYNAPIAQLDRAADFNQEPIVWNVEKIVSKENILYFLSQILNNNEIV